MQYTNPEIPEGINTSNEHPLKDFSILLGGALLVIVIVVTALSLSAKYLAHYIPFEAELSLADVYSQQMERYPEQEIYLQALADRLIAVMDLPDGMKITVHYNSSEVVNAFATLGGHVVIYKGLLEKLPNENAVAMVMAHEIAHIKHRDPVAALGRGVAIMIALSAITGYSAGTDILGNAGLYTVLKFNRDMESKADADALQALQGLYGHVEGAETLFQVFIDELQAEDESRLPQFFQTHPLEHNRIARIKQFRENNPALNAAITPLPRAYIESL